MKYQTHIKNIKINKSTIGDNSPTYFIADIAANHNNDLIKAKELIAMCSENGANAAKFQHFKAETIVSDIGFKNLKLISHQSKWKKSVYDVYQSASISIDWCFPLIEECNKHNIDFFTSPYDLDYVDELADLIPAFKIGSGDITWLEILEKIAKKNKPVLLATGASNFIDVKNAVDCILKFNAELILMQCNTNYTGNDKINIQNLNLNVLDTYKKEFPDLILGLSDHTLSNISVNVAVAKGAKVIEKHFTDNNDQDGPDHKFSLNPNSWKKMVDEVRLVETSLGDGLKKIENNELETSVLQRRSICSSKDLTKGSLISKEDLTFLRPCPVNSFKPFEKNLLIGSKLKKNKKKFEPFFYTDLA